MKKITDVLSIFGIVFALLVIASCVCAHISIGNLNRQVEQLEGQIDNLSVRSNSSVNTSDSLTLEFLASEAFKHREFIEEQEQFLIWLVAAIGSLGVALLGFLGFKSRKDIDRFMEDSYDEALKDQVSENLGAHNDRDKEIMHYLVDSARREHEIRRKRVLFATGVEEEAIELEKTRQLMHEEGYDVTKEVAKLDQGNIKSTIKGYDIIVFKVPIEECGKEKLTTKSGQPLLYFILGKECAASKKDCILYAPPGQENYLNPKKLHQPYTTTVNFYSKLRETLYMLLYFSANHKK